MTSTKSNVDFNKILEISRIKKLMIMCTASFVTKSSVSSNLMHLNRIKTIVKLKKIHLII